MTSAVHLAGVAGFPRPKIPKRLWYSLITSSPMASSQRAWLHDTPNSTLAGRRYLLELFVDPDGLRLLVPPDRSFRLSGPLGFPPAPRPQVRHAFDGRPPPTDGAGYPLSSRDRVSSGYPAARVRVAQSRCPGLGRTRHFSLERPLPRSERNYPHCATASWSWEASTTSSKQGGGSPSREGLAHPLVWHSPIDRGRGDSSGAARPGIFYMRALRAVNHVIHAHGVTARPTSQY